MSLQQKPGELLKQYVEQFKAATLEVRDLLIGLAAKTLLNGCLYRFTHFIMSKLIKQKPLSCMRIRRGMQIPGPGDWACVWARDLCTRMQPQNEYPRPIFLLFFLPKIHKEKSCYKLNWFKIVIATGNECH